MGVPAASISTPTPRGVNRWIQLFAGVVATMAISNLQYAWILFTKPLPESLHASLALVQVAFSAFIVAGTWLVPLAGYLVDRLGPRRMLAISGVLVGLGWIGAGRATTVRELIFWYTLGGAGVSVVATGTVGNALKWFPDHRGLCVGLTAAAYGGGTALTVARIAKMIDTSGYAHTFVTWGIIQGIVVILTALILVKPPAGWLPHSMLSSERAKRVVSILEQHLLTPYGLRSLAPSDPQYRGRYTGDSASRDGAYHQGTVWPWLMGPSLPHI